VKRSNRLVIFVGVLLAILAFVGIVILLNQPGGSRPDQEPTTAKVLVAKQAIAIGTAVNPDMVEVKEVPPNGVNGTPLSDPSQVGGRAAVVNVPARGQVSEETFAGGGSIAAMLKPGERAIAIQLDRTTGLNFLTKSGDSVDVVLSQEITVLQPAQGQTGTAQRFEVVNGLDKARTVKAILQNKRVLFVSTQVPTQTSTAPSASATPAPAGAPPAQQTLPDSIVVLIAGTDQDAEVLKFAQRDQTERGALSIVIRAVADTTVEKTTGVTIDRLVTQYGLAIPNIIKQLGAK